MVGHRLFYTVSKLFITVFSPTHSALIHNITQLRYYYIIPLACHLLLDIGNNVKLKRNIICVTSKSHCEHIWFHLAPNTFNCVYIISTSSSVIGANTTFRIFIFSVALCHTYEKSTDRSRRFTNRNSWSGKRSTKSARDVFRQKNTNMFKWLLGIAMQLRRKCIRLMCVDFL